MITGDGITPPNFTQIPNVIFDYWMDKLKPIEFVVLMCLCRKIFGWHKSTDLISRNQLMKCTGLSRSTIKRSLDRLEELKLIVKFQEISEYGSQPNQFRLNIEKPLDERYVDTENPEDEEDSEEELQFSEENGSADSNLGGGGFQIDQGGGFQIDHTKDRLHKTNTYKRYSTERQKIGVRASKS